MFEDFSKVWTTDAWLYAIVAGLVSGWVVGHIRPRLRTPLVRAWFAVVILAGLFLGFWVSQVADAISFDPLWLRLMSRASIAVVGFVPAVGVGIYIALRRHR